jgi:RNA polymerase sigma factor (sigma-70 family)
MAHTTDDADLLDRYATSRDDRAFADLVRRYVNLVYSAALRRVGDPHLAEDVTQAVFIVLAEKPHAARAAAPLSAWLLTTVRYAAANALKVRRRRRLHEERAASTTRETDCSPNPADVLVWREVAEQLDDAVLKLPAPDRHAILLRYFEQKPVREIAQALNVSEAAAKRRLSRSVDRLRQRLNRRGAILASAGPAGLAALMEARAVGAVPVGLPSAAAAAVHATSGATSLTIAKGVMTMMTWTKIKTVAAILAVASILGTGAVVGVRRGVAQAASDTPRVAAAGGAALHQKALDRVKAAEKLMQILDDQLFVGSAPMSPALVELRGAAARRLAEARVDAAENHQARVNAAEQYVQQCRKMLDVLNLRKEQDVAMVQLRQGEYHLADAEYYLAQVQSAGR